MKAAYWRKRKHDESAQWERTSAEQVHAACAPYWTDPLDTIRQTRLIWSTQELFAISATDPNKTPLRHKHGGMVGAQL